MNKIQEFNIIFKRDYEMIYSFDTIAVSDNKNNILHGKYKNTNILRESIKLIPNKYQMERLIMINSKTITIRNALIDESTDDKYIYISIDKKALLETISIMKDKNIEYDDEDAFLCTILFNCCKYIKFLSWDWSTDYIICVDIEKKDILSFCNQDVISNILGRKVKKQIDIELEKNPKIKDSSNGSNLEFNAQEIINKIKEKVVEQDSTVITVVNNILNNQKIIDLGNDDLINSAKVNILIDGPTGTGKTLISNLVAKTMNLPIVIRPVTEFSTVGYRGADLTNFLIGLLDYTNGNVELAERGIIVLDEFDKLGYNAKDEMKGSTALQNELLSYLSGAKFDLDYHGRKIIFDTSKITFICLGAFNDLRERKIKENEKKYKQSMGFMTNNEGLYSKTYEITQEDYVQEGLRRELVGRIVLLTSTSTLTVEKLEKILYESSLSPLKSLEQIGMLLYNVKIIYNKDIVRKIAELAYEDGFGARSLQTIVNN